VEYRTEPGEGGYAAKARNVRHGANYDDRPDR
jgi:hypothetical protein